LGVTDAILKEALEDDGEKITGFFADIQTMETFHLTAQDYFSMHRWDRNALKYYSLLKNHYEKKAMEKGSNKGGSHLLKDEPELAPSPRRGGNG
jgi:hypothetical protein